MTNKITSKSSAVVAATNASSAVCNYLIILDYGDSCGVCSNAYQLATELLRWPEEVAAKVCCNTSFFFPPIPVTNKYFSTKVHIVVGDGSELNSSDTTNTKIKNKENSLMAAKKLLQPHYASNVGCVIIVNGSILPERIPWHCVPMSCLFRVLLAVIDGDVMSAREEMWCDACLVNGFEYVQRAEMYEVVPREVAFGGLLGADYKGAARVYQILHNTMWPEASRSVALAGENRSDDRKKGKIRCVSNIGGDGDHNHDREKGTIAVIGVGCAGVINWLCAARTDHRFFTLQYPLQMNKIVEKKETRLWSNLQDENRREMNLIIANKYYVTTLEVVCIHPVYFFPAMTDLFLTEYADIQPKVVVLCWPPTDAPQGVMNSDVYPPLPVFVNRLQQWGAENCVILKAPLTKGKETMSLFDKHYCEEQRIEIVEMERCWSIKKSENYPFEFGTRGADRLAEIIHLIEWPQAIPMTVMSSSSSPQLLVTVGQTKENRLLLWACARSAEEEEQLLYKTLSTFFATSHAWRTADLPSMSSCSFSEPVTTINVRNRYFEALVHVHCFGGARSSILRETPPTKKELCAFGVVFLLTSTEHCETAIGGPLISALKKCVATQRDVCGVSSLVIDDAVHVHSSEDLTRRLCDAAEVTAAHLLFVVDGDESDEHLATCLEGILQQVTTETCEVEKNGDSSDEECSIAVEVLHGVGEVDAETRLQEVIQQHLWPIRKMTMTNSTQQQEHEKREKEEKEEVPVTIKGKNNLEKTNESDVVALVGCELPPDYLVDPFTLMSVRVMALAAADDNNGDVSKDKQAKLEKELVEWMEKMKQHGHALPRAVRRRQAEVLANKLSEHLHALDET